MFTFLFQTYLLLLALTAMVPGASHFMTIAQSCNPAVVSYIVRDENGKVLSESELKTLSEQLPETIDDARLYAGEVSLADDGERFYWPESLDWKKREEGAVPAVH